MDISPRPFGCIHFSPIEMQNLNFHKLQLDMWANNVLFIYGRSGVSQPGIIYSNSKELHKKDPKD